MVEKIVVSKGELLKMMNEELYKHIGYKDCKFTRPVTTLKSNDKNGCNWSKVIIRGKDLGSCRDIASKIITKFRRKYNIKYE